jgi:CRP-like cAMP-binding protein
VNPDREALIDKLLSIGETISNLPSTNATVGSLLRIQVRRSSSVRYLICNVRVWSCDVSDFQNRLALAQSFGLLDDLTQRLTTVNASLAALPSLMAVNVTVVAIQMLADQFNITAISNVITVLNTTIRGFPDDSAVVEEIKLLVQVPEAIPCISAVIAQIQSFNASLFRLPPVLDALNGLADEINSTISEKLPVVTQFNDSLATLLDELVMEGSSMLTGFSDEVSKISADLDVLKSVLASLSQDLTAACKCVPISMQCSCSTTRKRVCVRRTH